MSDVARFSSEGLNRVRQVAREVRDTVAPYLKDAEVKVKDWNFTAGANQNGTLIDIDIKLELKPKNPKDQDKNEQKPTTPP